MKRLRRLRPGGQVYSQDLNELFDVVEKLLDITGDGLDVEMGAGGIILRRSPEKVRIQARVWADTGAEDADGVACTKTAYQWVQREANDCGEMEDMDEGMSGSVLTFNPAFLPGDGTVADDTDVELVPGKSYLNADGILVQEWVILLGSSDEAAECHIPENALEVDPDEIYGVTCLEECCYTDHVSEICADGGIGLEFKRVKIYYPHKVKQCEGEWEPNSPPSDWSDPPCGPEA